MPTKTQTMILNEAQLAALNQAATAELRTQEQMLSLIMAEGIRYYFFDYEPPHGNLNKDEIANILKKDAIRQVTSN